MTAAQAEPRRRVIAASILLRDLCCRGNEPGRKSAKHDAAHAERRALQEVASRDRSIHAEVFVGGFHAAQL
jgi:hypothetical protein